MHNAGIAHGLASYFGDDDVVPDGMCGRCTFCTTGAGVSFTATAEVSADPKKIKEILDACIVRDDPRLLARFAFGITSPRLAALKCSTYHHLFGSMVKVDFQMLVNAFDKECKKVNYENVVIAAPTATRKRAYNSSSTSTYGRGGNSKRARR